MSDNISDADLERFLRRRDRLSREYQALGSESPAAALDARVLEEARAAVEKDGGSSGWHRPRWPTITALAATVLLSLGLILRLSLETDQAVLVPAPMPERASTAAGEVLQEQSAAAPPAAPAPTPLADAAPPADLSRAQIEPEIRAATERSKLSSPASAATEMRVQPAEAFEAKRADERAEPQAGLMKQERAHEERASAPEESGYVPAPASARPAAESDSMLDKKSVRDAAPAAARAPKARQRALSGNADEAPALREPEAWLDEIGKLRAAGLIEEAEREMERFVAVYPRYLEEHPRPPRE